MDFGSISTTTHCPTSSLGTGSMDTSTHVDDSGHSRIHPIRSTQHFDPVNTVQSSPSTDGRTKDSSTNTLSPAKQLSNDRRISFEHTGDPMDGTNDTETINRMLAYTSSPDSTKMQQLMSLLPEDLYTELIIEYEPSIQFCTIREEFLEISFSPEDQIIFILSCHLRVYKLSFILRNLIPLRLPPSSPNRE